MSSDSGTAEQHDHNIKQGLTTLWFVGLAIGFVLLFGFTQWGFISDVPDSEIDWIAIGTANAIGLLAIGGWNAIGLISIGGANSIGVITIGGLNSFGLVTFAGVNSAGFISFGGLNSYGFIYSVTVFRWNPLIRRGSREIG